jgi:hypothetical protein
LSEYRAIAGYASVAITVPLDGRLLAFNFGFFVTALHPQALDAHLS